MSEPTSFDTIYAPWAGNAAAMARDIGERAVTVSQWRYRGSVPPKYWPKIITAAVGRGYVLTLEDFVDGVAHVPAVTAAQHGASPNESGKIIGEAA